MWRKECNRFRQERDEAQQQANKNYEAWRADFEGLQAQVAMMRGALKALINKYWANKGGRYEFISCITPDDDIPDYWVNADKALQTTPAEAAERVNGLVEALEYTYNATAPDIGLTMHETTRIYSRVREALTNYRGEK